MTYLRPATFCYLLFIVLLNTIFSYVPNWEIFGFSLSPADFLVGLIYVLRDFAQRESKHGVLVAMLLGCFLSYLLAEKQAAVASVMAFIVGESLDWTIFTFSRQNFSRRVLVSSLVSVPADSVVNLYFLDQLNSLGLMVMIFVKILGVLFLWQLGCHRREA